MGIVEQGKYNRRRADIDASTGIIGLTMFGYLFATGGATWWIAPFVLCVLVGTAMAIMQWVRLDKALHHPLLYLLALRDEFGGE